MERFILTGTPGSGKTSVIEELGRLGHSVIHEAATEVIELEQSNGIEFPWKQTKFVPNIIKIQKERQINANEKIQFYDRSPFCTYALEKYFAHHTDNGIPSDIVQIELERCLEQNIYSKNVFFFENLGFIVNTPARQITYKEAILLEQMHLEVYQSFDFNIILVSKELTITERAGFILSYIDNLKTIN